MMVSVHTSQAGLHFFTTIRTRTDGTLEKEEAYYKHHFDKSVRVVSTFSPGQYVLVNLPPHQLIAAVPLAPEPCFVLHSKGVKPFQKISTTPDTVSNGGDGIYNALFTDCVAIAPDEPDQTDRTNESSAQKKSNEPLPAKRPRDNRTEEVDYPAEGTSWIQ